MKKMLKALAMIYITAFVSTIAFGMIINPNSKGMMGLILFIACVGFLASQDWD